MIGAGLVGLATAFELTELDEGCSVVVMDPSPLSGASYHAAGMLAPAAEMQYQQDALLPLMRQSAVWYPSLVRRVARAAGGDADDPRVTGFRRDGTYVVAVDSADRLHLEQTRDYQASFGMAANRVSVRELRTAEPALSPQLSGAVYIPGDHQVDPRVFGRLLMEALRNREVEWVNRAAVPADMGAGCRGRATTVVANGVGAADFFPYLQLRSVWGDILRLRVPSELDPLVTSVIRGYVRGRPVYLVPRVDGGLVLGATSREDDRDAPLAGGVLDLLRDAATMCPGIRECSVEGVTAGARPGTPDDCPYIGLDHATGAVVSTGYSRHGIVLTAMGARVGAALAVASAGGGLDDVTGADMVRRLDCSDELLARADDDDPPELTVRDIVSVTDIYRDA